MRDLQVLTAMPDEKRRRLHLRSVRRRRKKYEMGLGLNRDELLDYLRKRNFRTRKQLRCGRQTGDPREADYQHEFGNWRAATTAAFGRKISPSNGADYLVKVVVQLNLWTREEYARARKREPEIVPSIIHVRKRWGSFGNLVVAARQYDDLAIVEDFLKLYRRFGRIPTIGECHEHGVNVKKAITAFGGRKKFDDYVDDILAVENAHAAKRGSS